MPEDWKQRALELAAEGMKPAAVARELGLPYEQVYYVVRREKWERARQPVTLTCPDCGIEFQRARNRLGTGKCNSCSRGARGDMVACEECGDEFYRNASDPRRLYCSRTCWATAAKRPNSPATQSAESYRRTGDALSRKRRGKANPNYRHGKRVGGHDREGARRFKSGQATCQHPECEGRSKRLNEHHVVYDQHVRDKGGDRWDARNALALCSVCHQWHHKRSHVLPLAVLRDETYAFAAELLGPAAYDYLRRRYAGDDVRLDALLAPMDTNEREIPRVA